MEEESGRRVWDLSKVEVLERMQCGNRISNSGPVEGRGRVEPSSWSVLIQECRKVLANFRAGKQDCTAEVVGSGQRLKG